MSGVGWGHPWAPTPVSVKELDGAQAHQSLVSCRTQVPAGRLCLCHRWQQVVDVSVNCISAWQPGSRSVLMTEAASSRGLQEAVGGCSSNPQRHDRVGSGGWSCPSAEDPCPSLVLGMEMEAGGLHIQRSQSEPLCPQTRQAGWPGCLPSNTALLCS